MAKKSKCFITCVAFVFLGSVLVRASPLEKRPIAREKRTITVLARGLANIFGLDLENGQSPSGLPNPTTSNPLVITYPPVQRTTQPYQQLKYPTTTPPPAPITYHPPMTLPPTTTRHTPPRIRDDLNTLPTSRPVHLTPMRLITIRPAALSPTRIITSKPISINTFLQTEKTVTHSSSLDAKKEVVLIGIPVTIHKIGGLNLGLFNGGNDGSQLKQFQNVYTKSQTKDIENVEETKKVKENSFKNIEDFGTPSKDLSNVGLVDNYDTYRTRIINKVKTQGSSEISNSNNFDFTTSSPPFKYDEFDIPDVASRDAGNHHDNDEYSDRQNERETWKFYKEETKNIRPVKNQQVHGDSETRGKKSNQNTEYDGQEKKQEHDHSVKVYEHNKELSIMKLKGKSKDPINEYQNSEKRPNSLRQEDEKNNPSSKDHSEFEHQNYNKDNGKYDTGNQRPDRDEERNVKDNVGNHHYRDSNNNDGYRNNPKYKDNSDGHNKEGHRESMEDNIGKHRYVGNRETDNSGRYRDEERGHDSKSRHVTPDSERGHQDEGKDDENNGGGSHNHNDHSEFDYGQYKDDWKEEDDFSHKYRNDKNKKPEGSQQNYDENDAKHKEVAVELGNDRYKGKHWQTSKNEYKTSKNRNPQKSPEEIIEESYGKHREEADVVSGYGHYSSDREEKERHVPEQRYKTPKDEKRKQNPVRQQDNKKQNGGNPHQVDQISWDYGNSDAGRDSGERGYGEGKAHPDGWKNQEGQEQSHSSGKQNAFNYEQNAWDVNHNPSQGSVLNSSSHNTANVDKGKPENVSGNHEGNHEVFDYEQYTKNHGVHGFQFPSPYQNLHSPPENFWAPTPQSAINHGPSLPGAGYQPHLYSYDAPGYFGPFTPPSFPQQGHSLVPDPIFNPHAVVTEHPRPDAKGPQRRTQDFKSRRTQSEVDELASDGLSSELQREVPAGGLRPKKHDTGRNRGSGQRGGEVHRIERGRSESSTQKIDKTGVRSNSYSSPSRPRGVLQAIQQIENNRRPQLWPSPFDGATDSSRRVPKFQDPKQRPLPKTQNLHNISQSSDSQNEHSRAKNQNSSKFEPFNTKSNEKVELKFGWPKSYLKKTTSSQRSQSGYIKPYQSDAPSYTKNSKTSYQADAELYDFGVFNKNTGHYEVQGSAQKSRNQAEPRRS